MSDTPADNSECSFVVYIDESGDEGFKFRQPGGAGGSSNWFVLSAAVFCVDTEQLAMTAIDSVRLLLKRKPGASLHFRDLQHHQRVAYVRELVRFPMMAVSVLTYKPELAERKIYREKNYLYFYACRLLLERVSWLCRERFADLTRPLPGNGSARLVFSNRDQMKYSEFEDYLELLMTKDTTIHWPSIRCAPVESAPHGQLKGLHYADAIASSFYFAVERNEFGFSEPRYALELAPRIYSRSGSIRGYGVKAWPSQGVEHVWEMFK